MRLLHILSQRPGRSGSGVFLKAMIREGARRGYRQHAIVAGPPETSAAELPPLAGGEVSVISFPSPEAPFPVPGNSDVMPYPSTVFSQMTEIQVEQYLAASRRVMAEVRERFRPDVVHTHHLWLMTSLAREVFSVFPVVTTSHNAELRQLVKAPHLAPRVLPGVRGLDRVCVLTPRSKRDTEEAYGVEEERIALTGAGYDPALFHPPSASPEALREDLARHFGVHLPAERLVTFVGRLSTPKGIPFLLAAAAKVAREGRAPFRFVLVGATGTGEDGRHMAELVSATGDLVLSLGAQPEEVVARVLQLSDLFVLPSLFEGLPLTMLEAAACGCPCLVSGLPTIASWVPEEWTARGWFELVPPLATTNADRPVETDVPRYVDALADALRRQLIDPLPPEERAELATRLREHSWPAVFARYEAVYGEARGVSRGASGSSRPLPPR